MDTDVRSLKVVRCPYYPMSTKDKTINKSPGLFVVIYSEEYDTSVVVPQNVLALKVTTARPYSDLFVRVSNKTQLLYGKTLSTFSFEKESYILGSHLNTLPICDCTIVGELPLKESAQVLSVVSKTFGEVFIQSCNTLPKKK